MKSGLGFGAALLCALGAVVTAGLARAAATTEAARPNLSGAWRLNEKESDNPRARLHDGQRRGPRAGGFGGGGMGGRGGGFSRPTGGRGGGFGGGGPGTGGSAEGGGGSERMQERFRTLTIEHTEPVLHVLYGDQRDDTFYTDGRTVKREHERGFAEVKTQWEKNRVVIERDTPRGKAKETLELSPDGKRLLVTTEMPAGPLGELKLRRVYDPATTEPEAAPIPAGQ